VEQKTLDRELFVFMNRIRYKFDFEALNSHYFPFDKIYDGFNIAIHQKADVIKVMLTFDV